MWIYGIVFGAAALFWVGIALAIYGVLKSMNEHLSRVEYLMEWFTDQVEKRDEKPE